MRLAVMQPYFFSYIGYYQLIHAVDKFVFLDDVNFIKQGWINRNRILINGNESIFSVPLKNASQNNLINATLISEQQWKNKFMKTIELAYKKAPQFNSVFNILKEVIYFSANDMATLAKKSVEVVCSFLEIDTDIVSTSSQYNQTNLKGEERIISIAIKENASYYFNPIGGTELYHREAFLQNGIELRFLKTSEIKYKQFKNQFVPYLSIIDVLMFNEKQAIQEHLEKYELVCQ